jgi:hypothetical protein
MPDDGDGFQFGLSAVELASWLSCVLDASIEGVRIEPLRSADSASGVPLFRVAATTASGLTCFVVKVASPEGDWIARATGDDGVRDAALFRAGLPAQLPSIIDWPVIDARRTAGDAWCLLMRDLAAEPEVRLVPPGDDPVEAGEVEHYLTDLAALHQVFLDRVGTFAGVRFCDVGPWMTLLGPATIERERGGTDPVTPHLAPGWSAFARLAPAPIASDVVALLTEPAPLVDALKQGPATLLHGDFKFGNLGRQVAPRRATIALDWSLAAWASPLLDLAYFLAVNSARLPFPKERAIGVYREEIGELYGSDWERALDLALLGGGVLRLGWAKALGAASDDPTIARRERAEIDWWLKAAERGLGHLAI